MALLGLSWLSNWLGWNVPTHKHHTSRSESWGLHALAVAESILGWGEVGGNNQGAQITVLRRGRVLKPWQSGAWCASTCSYEIEEGWARLQGFQSWDVLPSSIRDKCPVKRTPSASGLMRRVANAGQKVEVPRPGDFVLFKHPRNHHVAIVSLVNGNEFETIDGNRGRFNRRSGHGSKVRRYQHELGEPQVRYFARLP